MLYWGIGKSASEVYLREGYKDAESVLQSVDGIRHAAKRISVVGPSAELDQLRVRVPSAHAAFFKLDSQAFWM